MSYQMSRQQQGRNAGLRDVTNISQQQNTMDTNKPREPLGAVRVAGAGGYQNGRNSQRLNEGGLDAKSANQRGIGARLPAVVQKPNFTEAQLHPERCTEYAQRIEQHLVKQSENASLTPMQMWTPNGLRMSAAITSGNRQVLLEWMAEVHMKFRLCDEVLFLAQNILDRCLYSFQNLPLAELQLLGTAALWMASKVEEIHAPEVNDFYFVTDNACTVEQLLDMEIKILNTLEFNLAYASPLALLHRMLIKTDVPLDCQHRFIAQYLLELAILDDRFLRYSATVLVGSVDYLTRRLLRTQPAWPASLQTMTKMSEVEVKAIAKQLYQCVPNRADTHILKTKYSKTRFLTVSQLL